MSESELDEGLLQDFITESKELLEEFTSSLSAFEADPTNLETINPVFRAAHTLKGSSAFFGLNHIKDFAHKLENLLDDIRHGKREASPKAIEYLFLAGNHLKSMFDRLSAGNMSTELLPEEAQFQDELVHFIGEGGGGGGGAEQFKDACQEIKKLLGDSLETGVDPETLIQSITDVVNKLPLESLEAKKEGAPEIKRPEMVSYQGVDLTADALAAFDNVTGEAFDPKAFSENLKNLGDQITANSWEDLKPAFKEASEDFTAVYESGLDFDPILVGLIKSKYLDLLGHMDLSHPEDAKPDAAAPGEEASSEAKEGEPEEKKAEKQERKTMRISEEKVDGFMSYVGELIVTAETFNYLQKTIEQEKVNPNTIRAFKNANQAFRELSDELQESLMEIRRVPIKGILQKVNMMARELSH
ncbi:MAG: Hpt domain-containing protein, partial [Deltaproteobacteria bacterium]|nr:Hpt domain-containing protein [Deltaproteobacteria bacterium]